MVYYHAMVKQFHLLHNTSYIKQIFFSSTEIGPVVV